MHHHAAQTIVLSAILCALALLYCWSQITGPYGMTVGPVQIIASTSPYHLTTISIVTN